MTSATYLRIATSSSIQNTRTHGVTHSGMKSDGQQQQRKQFFFINKTDIPQDRKGDKTYGRIICVYREGKKDKYHTRITVGGNLINYPGDCGTPTADLLTVKLLFNSIISTPNAKFISIDIKDFYLCTPMKRYDYFRMKIELFPEDIIQEYDLRNKVDATGNIHCEV